MEFANNLLWAFFGGLPTATLERLGAIVNVATESDVVATVRIFLHSHPISGIFWALRGARPNFGIATSATVKSYPASEEDMQAIQDLVLTPDMVVFLHFLADPTTGSPTVIAAPFLHRGNATTGKAAFSSLYAIGPVADSTSVQPYNYWNDASNALYARGSSKSGWAAGFQTMVPRHGAGYGTHISCSRNYPEQHIAACSSKRIPSLRPDSRAAGFGNMARDLLQSTSGLPRPHTYINFSHGDEDLEVVYGHSLARLWSLKKYDPNNVFNQCLNIV
ncbi:hypothetical protein K445DRAFT_374214 [Daldinia sp. EC12]|nr:hypothetical protein K445DRAFT_374214 [Daldinia sp. EC12]